MEAATKSYNERLSSSPLLQLKTLWNFVSLQNLPLLAFFDLLDALHSSLHFNSILSYYNS